MLSEMPTWTKEAPGPEYVRPAAGQVFCVMLNGRYRPGVQRIKALLASGVIGQVTSLHCDVFTNSEAGAFHEGTKHPLLFNMAVHSFDTAQVLAGRNARAVTCREWNPIGSRHDKASSAMAVFEMGGRIIFTYRGSCCANAFPTSPYGAWRITCTGGSLLWDGEDDIQARTSGAAGHGFVEIPPPVPDEPFSGHLAVMRDFIAATRGGPEPDTHRSQHRTHAMLFAAAESSERGRRRALSGGDSVIAVCAPPPAYR